MAGPDRLVQREGELTAARIEELRVRPVAGAFDAAHLREVHRRIFQDLPHHDPGEFRRDAPGHIKGRQLESTGQRYHVHYATRGQVDAQLDGVLTALRSGEALKGLDPEAFAQRMARLYGDLDHLHPFKEGNSRTLRAFTQQLAKHAGHGLDWAGTDVDAPSRDRLYIARDVAVTARAFPGLDQDRAMKTESRAEYEAFVQIVARYRNAADLLTMVREAVSRQRHLAAARSFREQPPADALQAHPELAGAFAAKAAAVERARADGLSPEQVDAVAARVTSHIAAGLERGQFPLSNSADRRTEPGPAVKRPRDIER